MLLAWIFGEYVSRSLIKLSISSKLLSEGKLDVNLDTQRKDEIGTLARAFQEMENKIPIAKLEKMKELVKNYFNDKNFKELKNKEMLITLYNNKINVKKIYDIMNQEKEIEI
jgi:nitrogen fixation/metabolism regulation signal transduction histidine kinase